MIRRVLAVSGCLSLFTFGCASVLPQRVPEASTPFQPTGTVKRSGGVAMFDSVRVRGPGVEMTKRTDGSWGGRVQAWEIEAQVDGKRISGVELRNLKGARGTEFRMFNRGDEQHVVVDGEFDLYRYHFEVHPDRFVIGQGPDQRVLAKNADGTYGSAHDVVLGGDAGGGLPPWPQIAFAVLGTEPAAAFFGLPHHVAQDPVEEAPLTPANYAPATF